ncbi:MAG: hypothetical protein ABIY39_00580, partial [Sphingomonas sp.]
DFGLTAQITPTRPESKRGGLTTPRPVRWWQQIGPIWTCSYKIAANLEPIQQFPDGNSRWMGG